MRPPFEWPQAWSEIPTDRLAGIHAVVGQARRARTWREPAARGPKRRHKYTKSSPCADAFESRVDVTNAHGSFVIVVVAALLRRPGVIESQIQGGRCRCSHNSRRSQDECGGSDGSDMAKTRRLSRSCRLRLARRSTGCKMRWRRLESSKTDCRRRDRRPQDDGRRGT